MTVVPSASTLCIVNIRQADAKVEAVLSEFVRLDQEAGQSNDQVHAPSYSRTVACASMLVACYCCMDAHFL